TKMGYGQVAQQGRAHQALEGFQRPAHVTDIFSACEVVSFGQRARARGAENSPNQSASAKSQSAGGEIRDQATQRSGEESTQKGRDPFIDRLVGVSFETLENFMGGISFKAMQTDDGIHGLANVTVKPFTQGRYGLFGAGK